MYISVHEILNCHKDNKNRKLNVGGADERELEEALQRSLKDYKDQNKGNNDDDEEGGGMVGTVLNRRAQPEEHKNNFKAFGGKGVSLVDNTMSAAPGMVDPDEAALYAQYEEDPELAMALKLSMMEQ